MLQIPKMKLRLIAIIVTGSAFVVLAFAPIIYVAAQQTDGSATLDPNFGTEGVLTTAISSNYNLANDVEIQKDGKIIIVGDGITDYENGYCAIARYNYDGSLDKGFNSTGIVTNTVGQRSLCTGVTLQDDGKIVAAGFYRETVEGRWGSLVMRYEDDGRLDQNFGNNGVVTTTFDDLDYGVEDILIQPDGKILAVGYQVIIGSGFHSTLVRYHKNGSLDMSFNTTGIVTTSIYEGMGIIGAATLQTDGKILVVGSQTDFGFLNDLVLIRYDENGYLDQAFHSSGIVTAPTQGYMEGHWSIATLSDKKIVVAGKISRTLGLLRYNSDGTLDTSFNQTGVVTTPIGQTSNAFDVGIEKDGGILAVGESEDQNRNYFAIVQYDAEGRLNENFNGNGIVTTVIRSDYDYGRATGVTIHNDGKFVVIGGAGDTAAQQSYFTALRFLGSYKHTVYLPIIVCE